MVDSVVSVIETVMGTTWIYPLMGALIFFDCFFPVLPSEVPLNLVGTWYGVQGFPDLRTMFIIAVVAAVTGDNLCYLLSTRLIHFVNRAQPGTSTFRALGWVRRNMKRNAGAAIVIARFIPSARLIMTVLLGAMRYPWPLFFFFDTVGVTIWAFQSLAIGWLGGTLFGGNPAVAIAVSILAAVALGYGLQRGINAFLNWRDVRRGFAATP
ncbi:membrane protein [Corynebacterium phocae]|uniref:Membrane protein n=1 Tax=Corynebacterium phocae TaxID=161895 RepID=A0A1L7D0T9_9CORY|nr:VTT domain-containing protein [Corynebacterium phocae]APT91766.1 membrane protein [Corynebacterium phocae]KAA8728534.1 DedA family protein [Corynebacterium phocae]